MYNHSVDKVYKKMQYTPQKHDRHSIRLEDYNYAQAGFYFITLCTHNREMFFGEIINYAIRRRKMYGVKSKPNIENIAIALGGNIGDAHTVFQQAVALLKENGVKDVKVSSLYTNPAVDCIENTPDFTNATLTGQWQKSPHELLLLCQKIELTLGRPLNHSSDTSRVIDLDIIIFGNHIICKNDLQIPHTKAHERLFVLLPLAEIAGDWIFPNNKCSVNYLLKNLNNTSL